MPKDGVSKIYSITVVAVLLVNHEFPLLNVFFQSNYMNMNSSLSWMFHFKIITET